LIISPETTEPILEPSFAENVSVGSSIKVFILSLEIFNKIKSYVWHALSTTGSQMKN
jgi:hypothetical protein